jgi:hypothetical protein
VAVIAAGIDVPWMGIVAGLMMAAALRSARIRSAVPLIAVALIAAAGLDVTLGEWIRHIAESSNWPSSFDGASDLVWAALIFLGLDVAIDLVRRRLQAADDGSVTVRAET